MILQINNLYTKIDVAQCTKTLKNTVKASKDWKYIEFSGNRDPQVTILVQEK